MASSITSAPPRRWRLRPGQQLLHRHWDDEFVVFNNLSGDCHLLDADGYDVLVCLQRSAAPLSSAELARQFGDMLVDDAYELDALEQVLASLAGCELIEALP